VLAHPLFTSDVAFTTTSGIHAVSIGEYVLAMILAWRHRLPALFDQQRRGEWPPDDQRWPLFVPDELAGQTIGIAGYGSIGRQVARLAHAFGMRVLALQQHAGRAQRGFILPGTGDPEGSLPERFFAPGELHALLAASDVVVIALPLTPATTRLFDAAAFAAMKPGALLVNIARGAIVDEGALVAALRSGPLGGAALDVFAHEPLPAGHPLWSLPNVLLSPHISGMTPHYDARASLVFAENLRRYRAGEPLLNLVDKAAGY
jgi:phosphoglycerate dehydrogenase-like enzyme